ncbi:MAG: carbohydrate kinase family protein [Myxococcota bacterium]
MYGGSGVTQFSFTLVERGTGRRNTFWTSGTVPMLTPNDIHLHHVLEGIDLLFVDGHHPEAQTALASAARERGITVVFGASSMTQGARTLVALSDVLIASERFSSQCSGIGRPDDALNALFKLGPSTVVITMGQEGSMGSDGDTIWRQAARHSEAKIDNLGAGDIYRGAFTYAWMSGAGLQACMQIATIAASLSLKGLGPRSDMPTREDLQSALKDRP